MGPMMKVAFFLVLGLIDCSLAETCAGCRRDQDANDQKFTVMLNSALSHYTSLPKGTADERTELVKIIKVFTQVVGGINYIFNFEAKGVKTNSLYICDLVLFERKWKGEESVDKYTCLPQSSPRSKRAIVGGEVELDIENNEYLVTLKAPIGLELNKQQKPKYLLGIVQFLRAKQQVVSGYLTKVIAEVAHTDCLSNVEASKQCQTGFQRQGRQVCNVEVWDKPWLQEKQVTVKGCEEIPYYCAGCPMDVSVNDEEANQCLKRTLFNLNSKSHSQKQMHLLRIIKIQSQVVAGLKYTYEFEVEDEVKSRYMCKAVIVTQPWISKEPLLDDFDCERESQ